MSYPKTLFVIKKFDKSATDNNNNEDVKIEQKNLHISYQRRILRL